MKNLERVLLGMIFFLVPAKPVFAKGVLLMGDSHVAGAFGITLDSLIRSHANVPVETYAVCGSIARNFFAGSRMTCGYFFHVGNTAPVTTGVTRAPLITPILERMKPDVTIIELGTNYAPVNGYSDTGIVTDLKRLVKAVKDNGSKCVFVSMPDVRVLRSQEPRILKLTKQAIGSDCELIDSTQLTHYPNGVGGGLHYDVGSLISIAKAWAQGVFERVAPLIDQIKP